VVAKNAAGVESAGGDDGRWEVYMAKKRTRAAAKKPSVITSTELTHQTAEMIERAVKGQVLRVERYGRPMVYIVESSAFEELAGSA
jgi:hypothetical protein